MKKIIYCLVAFSINYFGHEQHVHQYITKEAYYLLEDYLNFTIPEMSQHLDNGPVGPAWTNGTLLAGAWREDEEDIVYQYDLFSPGDAWHVLRSITHFWDADNGDYNENTFDVSWDAPLGPTFTGTIGPYPNSYSKIINLGYGYYPLYFNILPYLRVQKANGDLVTVNSTNSSRRFPLLL